MESNMLQIADTWGDALMEPAVFIGGWWQPFDDSPGLSMDQVMAELGYENPEELRAMRVAEDFAENRIPVWGQDLEIDLERLRYLIQTLEEQSRGVPSIIARLKDKKQPKRTDKRQPVRTDNAIQYANQYPGRWDWSLGGFTHYGSRIIANTRTTDEARHLRENLSVGSGLEAQRTACLRVEFESHNLEKSLGIR